MTRYSIVILALIVLGACSATSADEPVLGDGKIELGARFKLDIAAALAATPADDKIALQCWTFVNEKAQALPDDIDEPKIEGAAHALQLLRNKRRLLDIVNTDEFKLACGPLVADVRSRVLRIGSFALRLAPGV